jgi:hypothetical protein
MPERDATDSPKKAITPQIKSQREKNVGKQRTDPYDGRLCKSPVYHALREGHSPRAVPRRRLPILRVDG